MNAKIKSRIRRRTSLRARAKRLGKTRLTVHRTLNNIYAQVITPEGKVLASASTLDKTIRADIKHGGNIDAAQRVGTLIAERSKGIDGIEIVFDRSGYKYHGRIKALADAARDGGMEF